MTDGILCEAIRSALLLVFPNIYVGLPQDDGSIPMPCILFELQSDVVVGSPLQRGNLIVHVCSQADDTTPHAHSIFEAQVDSAVRLIVLQSQTVQLYGVVCQSVNLLREERHWKTSLNYVIGYGPKP